MGMRRAGLDRSTQRPVLAVLLLAVLISAVSAPSAVARGTLVFNSTRCVASGFSISLWTALDDGTQARALAGCSSDPEGAGGPSHPTLSPSGTEVAVVDTSAPGASVDVLRMDGSGRHRISFGDGWAEAPDWSPAGDLIAIWSPAGDQSGVSAHPSPNEIRLRALPSIRRTSTEARGAESSITATSVPDGESVG